MSEQHPNPNIWWYHRRMMAYASLAGLLILLIALFVADLSEAVVPLAQTLAWVFSANLLYYFAGNAAEALKGKQ